MRPHALDTQPDTGIAASLRRIALGTASGLLLIGTLSSIGYAIGRWA